MSLCIRPVVETWGESLTYSSRGTPIHDLIEAIADQVSSIKNGTFSYGDITVVYIDNGQQFLRYLETAGPKEILDELATSGLLSADDEEYARQSSDVQDLCQMAASWRRSIDPQDGSLRIYCD
jgi:hypothetical protein